ncbi:hypothetical protein ACH4VM_38380 [Streptomyces sp. NPDC020792]|uniref:hypothetical protein n=1 Tax=Streptomyces sp. NPDC020792 TaxID=3365089 RepID=UPI0037A43690
MSSTATRRMGGWGVLVLVALAQFIVILDTTIVNVALPSIQSSFGLSPENLQWVVTAYTLVSAVSCCSADASPTCSDASGGSSSP